MKMKKKHLKMRTRKKRREKRKQRTMKRKMMMMKTSPRKSARRKRRGIVRVTASLRVAAGAEAEVVGVNLRMKLRMERRMIIGNSQIMMIIR